MDAFLFLRIPKVGLGVFFRVLEEWFWEALGVTLATLGGLGRTLRALFGALRHLESLRVDSEATLGSLGREFGCLLPHVCPFRLKYVLFLTNKNVRHCFTLLCMALHGFALLCIALHCSALLCVASHGFTNNWTGYHILMGSRSSPFWYLVVPFGSRWVPKWAPRQPQGRPEGPQETQRLAWASTRCGCKHGVI